MLSQGGYRHKGKEKIAKIIVIDILNYVVAFNKSHFKLLDVGCGDGYILKYLSKEISNRCGLNLKNIELMGIDIYPGYKEFFKNSGIKFLLEDIFNIDRIFDKNFFDFIICTEVLEHVVNTDCLIKKIRNILKPEGFLFLTTPNLASYHGRISLLLGFQPLVTEVSNEYAAFGKGFWDRIYSGKNATGEPVHHVRVFTFKALKEFMEYHGFEIIKTRGVDYRFPFLWSKIPSLSPIIYMICKKKNENKI